MRERCFFSFRFLLLGVLVRCVQFTLSSRLVIVVACFNVVGFRIIVLILEIIFVFIDRHTVVRGSFIYTHFGCSTGHIFMSRSAILGTVSKGCSRRSIIARPKDTRDAAETKLPMSGSSKWGTSTLPPPLLYTSLSLIIGASTRTVRTSSGNALSSSRSFSALTRASTASGQPFEAPISCW
ncbi:hypothetical protein BD626DRAFT_473149 [Schizophyllum amplum]|uniref:Uncharacterized protein n=1 Tax=Schizophyllum amplum TaxID=97359 RepID=A0A550CWK2_9AGAR|nr:hypothetical protein BD626DRAFT_473149 [Auriculariopsis ampla]